MREPIGTTRAGQLLLGIAGLMAGIGGTLGLELSPGTFEPLLRLALYGLGAFFHIHVQYDPLDRTFFAVLLSILGMIWALLLGYAFLREPARNRAIDAYLRRSEDVDKVHRARIAPKDDGRP